MSISPHLNVLPHVRLATVIPVAVCAFLFMGCTTFKTSDSPSESLASEVITSSTPPFATREPERYQATRVITTSESSSNTNSSAAVETQSSTTLIARDGENRREEYDRGTERIVYLEGTAGRFVLLPSSKVFADLNAAPNRTGPSELQIEAADISTDGLLSQVRVEARYQKLGTQTLGDRATTKYRVTKVQPTEGTTARFETLIWIDEALGMPVRSETSYANGIHSSKTEMELKDVRLEVDQRLFKVPADYQQVECRIVLDRIRRGSNK